MDNHEKRRLFTLKKLKESKDSITNARKIFKNASKLCELGLTNGDKKMKQSLQQRLIRAQQLIEDNSKERKDKNKDSLDIIEISSDSSNINPDFYLIDSEMLMKELESSNIENDGEDSCLIWNSDEE